MLFGFWRAQERRLSPLDRKWSSSSRSGSRSAEKRLEDDLENDFSAIIPRRPELLWRWRHRLTIWTALPKLKTSFPRYTGLFCNRLRRIRGWCRSLTPAGPIVNSFANPPLCCLARARLEKLRNSRKNYDFLNKLCASNSSGNWNYENWCQKHRFGNNLFFFHGNNSSSEIIFSHVVTFSFLHLKFRIIL